MAPSRPRPPRTPKTCPVCGELVPAGALACLECGADHRSGWREDIAGSNEDDFDYDAFVQEEFGSARKPAGTPLIWRVTAIILLIAFAWYVWRAVFPPTIH